MTEREALKLALEALENTTPTGFNMERDKQFFSAIAAIKEALKQPEQEPVALPVGWVDDGGTVFWKDKPPADGADLYTVIDKSAAIRIATSLGWEPKRKPLTIVELQKHWQVAKVLDMTDAEISFPDYVLITKDVEALHGIKEKNT